MLPSTPVHAILAPETGKQGVSSLLLYTYCHKPSTDWARRCCSISKSSCQGVLLGTLSAAKCPAVRPPTLPLQALHKPQWRHKPGLSALIH